ncbi:MAG: VWA domain-containing protein [Aureliella sp.]
MKALRSMAVVSSVLTQPNCSVRPKNGAIVTLVAILLPVILLIAGFGIYIACGHLVRTELRSSVDFAARAGAKRMSMDQSESAGIAAAINVAGRNTIMGVPLRLQPGDITIGSSVQTGGDFSKFQFTPGGRIRNSIRVNGTTQGNSAVIDLFGRLANVSNRNFSLPAVATNLDRDICIVIDRSGSMALPVTSSANANGENCGPMAPNTRFAALARAIDLFLGELAGTPQQEQTCLVSYSSNGSVTCRCCPTFDSEGNIINECPRVSRGCGGRVAYTYRHLESEQHSSLSFDNNAVRGPVQTMLNVGIAGGTAIGSGLNTGINAVLGANARPFAFPTIVLLTDGRHNTGISPIPIANRAKDEGIVVHTVTFSPAADQGLMRQVADITGGRHLHADNEADLGAAFREIALTLPVMLTN